MPNAIETDQLSKIFTRERSLFKYTNRQSGQSFPAVDHVDLIVPQGQLFGLLGPNGAGKTTLIKLLTTLIIPSSGKALVNGYPLSQPESIKATVGLSTSDERSFYWRLSGRQNLEFFARLYGYRGKEMITRVDQILEMVNLQQVARTAFSTYSTGMRQRLSIARALLHRPSLIFLDEPSKGLDFQSKAILHKIIKEELIENQGATVFLTTHDLHEAQEICDQVAIMDGGRIVACGKIDELTPEPNVDLAQVLTNVLNKQPQVAQIPLSPRVIQEQELEKLPRQPDNLPHSPATIFQVFSAFLRRDIISEVSYRFSFLMQLFNILFSVGVFYYLSRFLGEVATRYLSAYGGDYFSFVLIGIAFSGYFGVGLSSFANNLRQSQTTGTLEALLATPIKISTIILASAQWDYLFTTIKVIVYLLIGVCFMGVNLQTSSLWAAFIILLLSIVTFSSLGIFAASFIMVLKRGDPITWLFSAFSTFVGGVYYPISVLPTWLQTVARFIPVTYALDAMRLALLKGANQSLLFNDMLILSAFCVILLPLSLIAFRFAVQRAKVEGSLSHY